MAPRSLRLLFCVRLRCAERPRLFYCAVALLLCSALGARSQTGSTVVGRIVYDDTGKPAAGISVWLTVDAPSARPTPDPVTGEYVVSMTNTPERRLTGKVAPDGTFSIQDAAPGSYFVHTYAPPYLSPDDTVYPTSDAVHVATGPQPSTNALRVTVKAGKPARVSVRLRRGGAIEGSVRLGSGAAAPQVSTPPYGVAISAERRLGPNQYARTGGAAHVDADGRYRLEGLAPGDYIIFASAGSTMVQNYGGGSRGGSGLPVYAPQTIRPSAASIVHIVGVETKTVDISFFPPAALHRITGTVSLDDAVTLRTLVVRLYPAGEGGLTAAMPLDASSGFTFNDVPDGTYTLSVDFPSVPQMIGITADRQSMRMRMGRPKYASFSRDVRVSGSDVSGIAIAPVAAIP